MRRKSETNICDSLLEAIPQPASIISTKGRIEGANSSFYRFFKLSKEKCIGRSLFETDIFPGSSILRSYNDESTLTPPGEIKFVHKLPDDKKIWVNLTIRNIDGRLKGQMLFSFEDQTEQINTELELQQSRERYREAQSIAKLGHWVYNFQSRQYAISKQTAKLFNLIKEFEERLPINSLVQNCALEPAHHKLLLEQIDMAIDRKSGFDDVASPIVNGVQRHYHILGHVNYDLEGNPEKAFGTVQDITMRKNAEDSLKESELRKAGILNSIPDLMLILNNDGRFLDFHCSNRDFPIRDPLRFMGNDLSGLKDPDLEEVILDSIHSVLQKNESLKFDHSYKTDNGLFHFEFRMAPAGGDEVLLIVRDISANANLEKMLAQSHKMEAIGRLAGGIAHDFNNMLQVIIGYSEMLQSESPGEEIETIIAAAGKGQNLIRQLLAFSKKQVLRPTTIHLNETIKSIDLLMARLLGDHIKMKIDLKENLPPIYADQGQIDQIVMNLCINSRDALPNGGVIRISTDMLTLTPRNKKLMLHLPPGDYVKFSLKDNGLGIQPELMDKIFDPFFTTKETADSAGLGLPTVYAIVKRHNGHIEVQSTPGAGTLTEIYFPATETSQADSLSGTGSLAPTIAREKVVLVAEDNELVRKMTADILKKADYRLITVSNGAEAVSEFKKDQANIDMLLLDVVMPEMNGQQAYEEISKLKPGIPVLFFSGYSEDILKEEYLMTIPGKLIQKPAAPAALLAAVRDLLD